MNLKSVFQFLSDELRNAVQKNDKARISDIGTTAEILYEIALKNKETEVITILERIDYIVFHYDEIEFNSIDYSFREIKRLLEKLV
jgi:hypothetical protein